LKLTSGDKTIMPHFERMNAKVEAEIAAIEQRITDADFQKVTIADLLYFSRNMLVDISQAWSVGNVDQKQRVQNVLFPTGLTWHPKKEY
jgi:hypothetical protein